MHNVLQFLRTVAARPEVLDVLKVKSKSDVIASAAAFGLPFAEAEFDALIWRLEVAMAARRKEAFDQRFSLWTTMWGQYYLEYLVVDLVPSLADADIQAALASEGNP